MTPPGDPQTDPTGFARHWIAAWNAKDVEAVLLHFADDVRFTSPKAEAFIGRVTLVGKPDLRGYWNAAAARIGKIHFELDQVVGDRERRTLLIIYRGQLDQQRFRAIELLTFDDQGRVVQGEAFYGAA